MTRTAPENPGKADSLSPDGADSSAGVTEAVRTGLLRAHKRLPPWLLYDARGSALFEEITRLPEYYLTRTEREILASHGAAMVEAAGVPLEIVELGAGSATKTCLLLEAALSQQPRLTYMPVDVSPTALLQAQAELQRYRRLTVRPVVARYPEELGFLREAGGRRLVLFLGSNIGNYDPTDARALLDGVRRHLAPGDALLLGADLHKSPSQLLPAYDDERGVTARFNKNVLARINRELGGHFDLDRFRHVVVWNEAASRLELYLESVAAQQIEIDGLGVSVTFERGERIHTESSYKLTEIRLHQWLTDAGFGIEVSWYDERRWYGVHLARVP